jgi:hypothetical protein
MHYFAEEIAGRPGWVAAFRADNADDVRPGIEWPPIAAITSSGCRVVLQRFAHYIRSRLLPALRQRIQFPLGSDTQPHSQSH